ncbi:hypothetical protein CUJ83_06090 [Methanocella sp. CWC-04]|uniref:Uncharacterized protein n=1 Tax=Methanooceanicella nereidis TaxID=2052831 RepID=A0AAP2RBK6_9EURY|nr:hypothetical protein [Methanocella sp. CWC-04]MCD1294571.1 hypothetical protein [Methanocella sp. CWC-04]
MNKKYSIIFVLVILAAVTMAGCSGSSDNPGPTATADPGSGSGAGTSTNALFDFDKFKVLEYKYTMTAEGMTTVTNYRLEYSNDNYEGAPAKHTKMTMTSSEGALTVVDLYTTPGGDQTLGGHMKMMMNNEVLWESDIPADDASEYTNSDPTYGVDEDFENDLFNSMAGTETVTVPAGTFTCNKYSVNVGGIQETWWIASNIPVPVKSVIAGEGTSTTMELVSWA